MDIPFVFIRFQLMLRIKDAHSKSERVFDGSPITLHFDLGVLGISPNPWGVAKGGSAGSDPPFDWSEVIHF